MKVKDVRLRGCGFTLFPVAKEEGVEGELMYVILKAIYRKSGIINEYEINTENADEIEKQNPDMPVKFEDSDFGDKLSQLKEAELIDAEGNLTEKTMHILEKAAEIQNKLDEEGFHHCPCRRCC